jgi:hypothetical protein
VRRSKKGTPQTHCPTIFYRRTPIAGGLLKKNQKKGQVGRSFSAVGLRFFGLFCKTFKTLKPCCTSFWHHLGGTSTHTTPATPPVGRWGNFKGRPKKNKKKRRTYLPTFFEIFLRFSGLILEHIFMVFLGSSCREMAKNAIKSTCVQRAASKSMIVRKNQDCFPTLQTMTTMRPGNARCRAVPHVCALDPLDPYLLRLPSGSGQGSCNGKYAAVLKNVWGA